MNGSGASVQRILVAGVGDILRGDDAFGILAIRELQKRELPENVDLAPFRAESSNLVSEIKNGYDAVILVEATPQGGEPGSIYIFDPEVDPIEAGQAIFSSRFRKPEMGLRVLDALDGYKGRILIVGCEPESFENVATLSKSARSALAVTVCLLERLVHELQSGALSGAELDASHIDSSDLSLDSRRTVNASVFM